jgi:hypothetical protein
MLRLLATTGGALMLGLIVAQPSEACSCAPHKTVAEALRGADAVFFGYAVVARLERGKTLVEDVPTEEGIVHTQFQVLKAWKGIDTPFVWISTSLDRRACGGGDFGFGINYLVFAHGSLDGLTVSACDRIRQEPDTISDIEALGKPQRTFSGSGAKQR